MVNRNGLLFTVCQSLFLFVKKSVYSVKTVVFDILNVKSQQLSNSNCVNIIVMLMILVVRQTIQFQVRSIDLT